MRIKEIIKNIYFLEDGQSYRLGVIGVGVNVGVDWSELPAWRHKGGGEVYP